MSSTYSAPTFSAVSGFLITQTNSALPPTIAVQESIQIVGVNPGSTSFDGGYSVAGSVSAGSPVVLSLASPNDPIGNPISVDRIISILIANTTPTTAGNPYITHGGGSSAIYATDPIGIGCGDFSFKSMVNNPLGINGVYGHNLELIASLGTLTYTVTILTRSA